MLTKNYTPVTEAYFGKTKNLMEIEKLVAAALKRFTIKDLKAGGKRLIDAAKFNSSPENRKIEALFCKEFGFKEMVLHWDGDPIPNAWTLGHGLMKLADGSEPILPIRNGDGTYYDAKHMYLCVVNIYVGGFADYNFTADEVVACILHEIGHNFVCTPVVTAVTAIEWAFVPVNLYKSLKHVSNIFDNVNKVVDASNDPDVNQDLEKCKKIASTAFVQVFLNWFRANKYWNLVKQGLIGVFQYFIPDLIKRDLQELDEIILKNKNKVLAQWEEYMEHLEKLKEYYKKNPTFLNFGVLAGKSFDLAKLIFWHDLATIEHFLSLQSGYSNEVFADSFATAYGYGAATVSLQKKLEFFILHNRALDSRNEYNVYNQYIYIMSGIMTTFLDEHPGSQTRMRKQIDKLKRELEDPNVDPRVRKVLMKDLDRAEKLYNEYLNDFPPELKHMAVIMNYNQLNEMYFGGKFDLRDPINRVLNFGNAEA